MLTKWAIAFLIITLGSALFAYTDIAVATAGIAKILFAIFLVLFLATVCLGMAQEGKHA